MHWVLKCLTVEMILKARTTFAVGAKPSRPNVGHLASTLDYFIYVRIKYTFLIRFTEYLKSDEVLR